MLSVAKKLIMLSVVVLSVIMLSVIMLSVIMLSVVALNGAPLYGQSNGLTRKHWTSLNKPCQGQTL
jgi:hypothetical protein